MKKLNITLIGLLLVVILLIDFSKTTSTEYVAQQAIHATIFALLEAFISILKNEKFQLILSALMTLIILPYALYKIKHENLDEDNQLIL